MFSFILGCGLYLYLTSGKRTELGENGGCSWDLTNKHGELNGIYSLLNVHTTMETHNFYLENSRTFCGHFQVKTVSQNQRVFSTYPLIIQLS